MKNYTKPKFKQPQNKNPADLLDVYIRNNKKQALLVHIRQNTHIDNISRAISARFRIPPENQILFHNGQTLSKSNANKLEDKAIIHVVDTRRITPEITINVRRLNLPSRQQFTISSSEIIEDFIVRNIRDEQPEKLFFVHTGRQLNKSRTFAQQFVQSESELFCLHQEKDEVKGERRQKYEKRIKEQAAKRQQPQSNSQLRFEEEENHSGLQSYLPKAKSAQQKQAQPTISQDNLKEETKPNFKKKNITKEINISSKQLNLRQTPAANQDNLSLMTQNNFQETNRSNANSGFFNEGSSISEIIPDQAHNPQSNKRSEEGSMFQSAFIGLTYDNSLVNLNPGQSRFNSVTPLQEQDVSEHSEKSSFSFDARAPELINALPPDRHLTLIEREILQVTESQQLSRQNVDQNAQNKQFNDQKSQGRQANQKEQSIENSQFELGQIQNHELSASAEMKVDFHERESPLRVSSKNNEILIEDQENNSYQRKNQIKLLPINEELRLQQEKSSYSAAQQGQLQEKSQENVKKNHTEMNEEQAAQQQDEKKQETKLEQCNTPRFQEGQNGNVDFYIIQQENGLRDNFPGYSQQLEQKNECETNGPSSNSNFYSKSSSRVKQVPLQANQYQFGDYNKNFNSSARRSGFNDLKSQEDQDLLFEKSVSENNSNHQKFEEENKTEQPRKKQSYRQDEELQIVQLPLEMRIKQNSSLLLDQYNQVSNPYALEVKAGKQAQKSKLFSKKDSKIDQLNNLISELIEHKGKDNQELLIQESVGPATQPENHFQPKPDSQIKFDTSIGQKSSSSRVKDSSKKQQKQQRQQSEESILERREIKKTINSYPSDTNLFEHDMKQSIHKQNFVAGQFIFRSEPNYFEPLQFYISLFEKELSSKKESKK